MFHNRTRREFVASCLQAGALSLCLCRRTAVCQQPTQATEKSSVAKVEEYRRPELLAICWLGDPVRGRRNPAPEFAWRPDGSRLTPDEIQQLHTAADGFDVNWRRDEQLRPLILVFRIDERAKWSQTVWPCVCIQDQKHFGGSFHDSLENHLVVSSIGPFTRKLAAWPAEVDIEIRTQIAEPEMILRLDEIPAGKVTVDKGVRWSIDPSMGINRQQVGGFPAAVTWWDRDQRDPLCEYKALPTLKSGKPLERRLVHPDYEISDIIEADNPVVSVEFWRRRYRLDRYDKVPTMLEKMPK